MVKKVLLLQIVVLLNLCGTRVQSQRISENKCRDVYSSTSTTPPNKSENNLEVGKISTAPGEFPYMVAVRRTNWIDGSLHFVCGGVLISPEYVLTAAQCADGFRPEIVQIGGAGLNDSIVANISIVDVFVHPLYNETRFYNDIAILKIKSPSMHRPACLWQSREINQTEVTVIGYGITSRDEFRHKNYLLKVNLTILPNSVCSQQFEARRKTGEGIIHTQICVGDTSNTIDSCAENQGGPLLVKINEKDKEIPYIVGINSFETGCGIGYHTVSTRVSSYLDWIESVVWP